MVHHCIAKVRSSAEGVARDAKALAPRFRTRTGLCPSWSCPSTVSAALAQLSGPDLNAHGDRECGQCILDCSF